MNVRELIQKSVEESADSREQGQRFETITTFFLRNDPQWKRRFSDVWSWSDAPTNKGRQDTGIDLVALDAEDGSYWAIQCKCYKKKISEGDLSTFFMNAMAGDTYGHTMVVDTSPAATKHLEEYMSEHGVVRVDVDTMATSNIDWGGAFAGVDAQRVIYEPRPHQREAIEGALSMLEDHDRCRLVMACGTGKTLTSLRLAESLCPKGNVLFLAPSISLVGQTMRSWANQAKDPIRTFVVCSDAKASKIDDDVPNAMTDMPFPATTNAETLASRYLAHPNSEGLTVIFSTYQSIDVLIDAQAKGLPDFDLIVCDEAHRTTGVKDLSGEDESAFVKVHSNENVRGAKRVYMTATPRVFGEEAKKKAEGLVEIASMDDESVYGPLAYRLSFGEAVKRKLLTDYKVVVMTVGEGLVSETMQRLMARGHAELEVDDVARLVGCWKALQRRVRNDMRLQRRDASDDVDFDERQLRHAIAFASSIKASQSISAEFQAVIEAYAESTGDAGAATGEVRHVDGTMSSAQRKDELAWLAGESDEQEGCRILSNARCLSEGIDVPNLDAVIYLSQRKSKVDIIQSVGRVMRRCEGKEFGYIIIPVFVPMGVTPEEALENSKAYATVWDIVGALRSHDERLDAKINTATLNGGNADDALRGVVEVDVMGEAKLGASKKPGGKGNQIGDDSHDGEDDALSEQGKAVQAGLDLEYENVAALDRAIKAQIVRHCGTKAYWDDWSKDVAKIAVARTAQIEHLVAQNSAAAEAFGEFLQGIRDSLNPGISEHEAVDMLAQHEITQPIFEALFDNPEVAKNNPVALGMGRAVERLYGFGLPRSTDDPTLRDLYGSVQLRASQVRDDRSRQNLIKDLYNKFFANAFKATSEKMGIVYTPVECVDAQLHMVQRVLKREFGMSLGDRGVHILDGFAGTGTYTCRLIEDRSLISDADLPYKYLNDLHSNEITPLAAVVMGVNIEQSYHARMGGEYVGFPGMLLTDTFQMSEEGDTMDMGVFAENSERMVRQLATPVTVCISNPPYSSGQNSENDNNKNEKYPFLDARIAATYAAKTDATLKNALYDSYIRAFRWASDRIGAKGVICFISNGGWLDARSMNGFRRCLVDEFNSIYVYNLRGNQRTQGEESRREGGKIFDSGCRATIAITVLVRNPDSVERGVVHYCDIGDYLTRDEKLAKVAKAVDADPEWVTIEPDRHGDWLNQRDDSFYSFAPMGVEKHGTLSGIFDVWSGGVKTNRDPWAYSFNRASVEANMRRMTDKYCEELARWTAAGCPQPVDDFVDSDEKQIKWTRELKADFSRNKPAQFVESHVYPSIYRPFCKQYLYMDRQMNNCVYLQPEMFPTRGHQNLEICLTGGSSFSVLMTDRVPDLHFIGDSQCFPLYYYEDGAPKGLMGQESECLPNGEARFRRHDAISARALEAFRKAYPCAFPKRAKKAGGQELTREDLFYYVYGVLHSPEYRGRFAPNLQKELPRIPFARDFAVFSQAGRALADLHLNYETIEPWPIKEVGDSANPGRTVAITFGKCKKDEAHPDGKDRSVLHVAENLKLVGVPEGAYSYMVGGKSAVAWLMDRYKVTTDKSSFIVNDPNDYSDDPRYIVDLVKRVVTVSMKTVEIMGNLPPIHELPQPTDWPIEWRTMG